MKKALLLALSIFAVFNVIAQEAILKEGGKRINGTASGQVLKWNGTAWVPGTDNAGSADSTWGKGDYASPTYSGKTITDAVFRRGKISLFTATDTAGRVNIYNPDTLDNTPSLLFSGDGEVLFKVKKDSRTSVGTDVNFVRKYGSSGDGNFNNQIFSIGINNTAGGGAENPLYPSIRYAIEENFRNGPTNFNAFECHLPDIYYPNGIGRRPISGYYTRNGSNLKGHTGFVSDYFVFHDFKDNALKATWSFRSPSPYALGIRFADSSAIYLGKNNFGGFLQRNAANNADVRIAYVNSANEVVLGGQNETSIVAYNALKISNNGEIWNENNDLFIGSTARPTRLTIQSNDGIGFSIKRTGHAYTATHGLFNQQYYITNPSTGTTPWRINMDAPEYSFWLRSTGNLGIGEANPTAKIHLTSTGGATSSMIALANTTGTSNIFRTNATPESAITASQGDLALSNTGELYGKVSGTSTNTGWGKYLNLKDGNSASSGQVLKWDGSAWTPNADNTGTPSQPNEQVVYGTGSGISSDTSYKYSSRSLVLSDVAGTNVPKFRVNYKDATSTLTAFELRPYNQTNFPYPTKFGIYAGNFPSANGGSEPGNHVWRMGYNIGRPATRLSSLEIAFESLYRESAGMLNGQRTYNLEWHIEQVDTLGGVHRPLTIRAAHNGTTGDIGLRSDGLYISRYDNDQHLLDYNRFAKTWYYQDTITKIFNKRQVGVPFMSFRSADNSRLYQMFSADASDRLVLNPEGNRLYTFAPSLYFNTAGEISTNDGNHITIGSATKPSKLRVEGNTGDLFTLIRGANSWPTNLNTDNIAYTRPNGNSYFQVYNGDAMNIVMGNNKMSVGSGSLQSRLSLNQSTNTAEGGLGLYNTGGVASYLQTNASNNFTIGVGSGIEHFSVTTAGDLKFGSTGRFKSLFAYDIAPNGNITGNPGDVIFRNNATLGELWLKVSGTGNTGWSKALALTDANSASSGQVLKWNGSSWAPANDGGTIYTAGTGIDVTGTVITNTAPESTTVGTFQTTSTANGLSISGTDIRLHSASGTTPGAVDLTNNQVLGDNTKILQKSNAAGIGTPLLLRNPAATGDDTGVSLTFQSGASNVGVATIESRVTGGSITSGTALEIYNRNGDNVLRQAFSIDQNNTAKVEGWFGGSVGIVGASLDVSAGLSNRKSNLQFNTAGGSLTLPISNVAEGTIVNVNSVYESGANATINTAAAYSEFAYDTDQDAGTGGNQFYTASISVAPMQSLSLKAMNISGELRWKVLSSGSGGGGGTATTLDDAYNNFGATASKINIDAAQSQTGGLEFEHSGANDFTVDLQGTGDFNVQDAGTPVFRIFDNGRASFGNIAPNTSQRLVVAEDGASSVGTPIRADNGATVVDNGGTQIALAYNGFDRLNLKAYNPSGSYLNAASIETTSGANITFTDDIRETRFNAAIAREITTVTATTHQCDGRTSFVRVPSSATTTTITLPEIVSGAAGSNQVNVGYEIYFSINRSVAVTINRAGTSDVFLIDSQSNSSLPTAIQTTGNIIFGKKLIASGLDEWTVVQ